MSNRDDRRGFLKKSAAVSAGAALGFRFEEKVLTAHAAEPSQKTSAPTNDFPTGEIKGLKVSRLVCGGNLISGFAHSRDLMYVSPLLKNYFTDEKVLETLEKCEENGINTAILRVDEHTLRLITRYWDERGGKIQWIAQAQLTGPDKRGDFDKAIDAGASAVFLHGGVGDACVKDGRIDEVGEAVSYIKKQGVPGGVAGHLLETVQAYEKAGIDPDFYMKTINSKKYWSAGPLPRNDSVWAETPEETVQFMKGVKKPWIGYKVMGAGAIHPKEAFQYAYENGADFICAGMFDFQITEDAIIARQMLSDEMKRDRPWCA